MKPGNQELTKIDQLPPNSPEAEAGVLGCIMLKPADCLNECEESAVITEWFFDLSNQLIFDTAMVMHRAGAAVDTITLCEQLKKRGALEEAGGYSHVGGLADLVPSAAQLPSYLGLLREKYLLRWLLRTCTEAGAEIYQPDVDAQEIISRVEKEVLALSEEHVGSQETAIKDAILAVINDLEDYHRGKAQLRGITTGLEYVDKLLCGFGGTHGNYIVLSARPNMGKTALAMDIILHAALDYEWWEPVLDEAGKPVMVPGDGEEKFKVEHRRGVPCAVFSLEMTTEALAHRLLFQRAQGDMQRWRTGFACAGDFPPLTRAAAEIAKAKIWIDDEGRCSIETLKAKARRLHRQHGIKLFVIDYIQLMRVGGKRYREDRVQELGEISGEIQKLGKELNVPFIVLAQMNRDYEKEPNRAPRLSDLKDCGSIEQDADLVGFLYTPKMKGDAEEKYDLAMQAEFGNDWSKYPTRVDLLWAKNRHGPTGTCQLLFQKSCTHFLDYNVWLKANGHKAPADGERPSHTREILADL